MWPVTPNYVVEVGVKRMRQERGEERGGGGEEEEKHQAPTYSTPGLIPFKAEPVKQATTNNDSNMA